MPKIKIDISSVKLAATKMRQALRNLQLASKTIPHVFWENFATMLDLNARRHFFSRISGIRLSRERIEDKRRFVANRTVFKRSPSTSLPAQTVFPWGRLTGYLVGMFRHYRLGATGLAIRQLSNSATVKNGRFVYGMDMSETIGDPPRLIRGYPLEVMHATKAFDVNADITDAVYVMTPAEVEKAKQVLMNSWMSGMNRAFRI